MKHDCVDSIHSASVGLIRNTVAMLYCASAALPMALIAKHWSGSFRRSKPTRLLNEVFFRFRATRLNRGCCEKRGYGLCTNRN